ncbi:unnamed protein product [Mytilus edulis]|uniref:Uncharacterized protein n=1 Tax=Mytilus edulis TaxID=6550 RepID=A0A8S3SWW7_MYTED|nr:unnamed protein product [Mytilus edulis]
MVPTTSQGFSSNLAIVGAAIIIFLLLPDVTGSSNLQLWPGWKRSLAEVINEESTTITAAMETDTLEEFDKDQFLEYSRLTTNKMLLAVTLDTGSMTMTSFASQLGNSFLQQSVQYAGVDFLDELQEFLSDHYKTKKLKIENKSLKDESNDEDQKKTVRDRKRKQEGSPFITDKKQKVAEKDLKSMSQKKVS